jgi:hypothetical protein
MEAIMRRKGGGVWQGVFPLEQVDGTKSLPGVRAHLALLSALLRDWEVWVAHDRLHVRVSLAVHVPGRGFGTDSAIIGNLEHFIARWVASQRMGGRPPSVWDRLRALRDASVAGRS